MSNIQSNDIQSTINFGVGRRGDRCDEKDKRTRQQSKSNDIQSIGRTIEGFVINPHIIQHLNHSRFRKPKNPNDLNLTGELNLKQKIGYAILMTLLSTIITAMLLYL